MRINELKASDIDPIKNFHIKDLGDVVIIAGANGSGKTRLKQTIISSFQNTDIPQLSMVLQASRPEESLKWGSGHLNIEKGTSNREFSMYMNSRTRGGSYTGTVIQIDSQRQIVNIHYEIINLSTPDPDDIEMDSKWYLNPFGNRWGDIVNKVYQKVANRDHKIAEYIKFNETATRPKALSKFPDPFEQYQKIFQKLLPGKKLLQVDPRSVQEFQYENSSGIKLSFSSLSSGEQEVIKIVFDVISKEMTHCIFLIDEPELHLHPTLTFRLIETLKGIGKGTNQFIFFTHSADLISTYYSTGNVYFISPDQSGANQAQKLSELTHTHTNLVRVMSENLGLFAVGKKFVFVEGEESSIDRLIYNSISQSFDLNLSITPVESVDNVMALKKLANEIEHRIFGVDFYMIRDKDGLNEGQIRDLEKNGKIKCLPRRHIENYFLDPEVMSKVCQRFILETKWHDVENLKKKTFEIAGSIKKIALLQGMQEYIKVNANYDNPTVKGLDSKDINNIKDEFLVSVESSLLSFSEVLKKENLQSVFSEEEKKLDLALASGDWINIFPGKTIFKKLCDTIKADPIKVRQAYIEIALKEYPNVFLDIIAILKGFA